MYYHRFFFALAVAVFVFLPAVGEEQGTMPGKTETGGDCSTCHSSATPSADDLIPNKRCLRSGNQILTPTPEEEKASPDIVLLDQLSDLYVPVVFPHKLHASMESMANGCGFCHHHTENGQIKSCRTCHGGAANPANLRQPGLKGAYHRQCLACHREWSNDTNPQEGGVTPPACINCHAKRGPGSPALAKEDPTDMLGRLHPNVSVPEKWVYPTPEMEEGTSVTFHHADHVDLFDGRCVECHTKENCSRCHNISAPHPVHVRQDQHEDCVKCHDITGDCTQCHRQGGERNPAVDEVPLSDQPQTK